MSLRSIFRDFISKRCLAIQIVSILNNRYFFFPLFPYHHGPNVIGSPFFSIAGFGVPTPPETEINGWE